jgi:transcriptional regulator with XRE-family HTH domain
VAPKPRNRVFTPIPYPLEPVSVGDFLRKRRIDLGMMQREVARSLNVSVVSIRNWEGNWREPHLSELPAIINFIGYCPYDIGLTLFQRVAVWRRANGLTQKRMAEIIGVDPSTLARLEQGRIRELTRRTRYLEQLQKALSAMKKGNGCDFQRGTGF